jgi:hypothetical protein
MPPTHSESLHKDTIIGKKRPLVHSFSGKSQRDNKCRIENYHAYGLSMATIQAAPCIFIFLAVIHVGYMPNDYNLS